MNLNPAHIKLNGGSQIILDHSFNLSLSSAFEQSAEQFGHRFAIIDGTESITYKEMNIKANEYSEYLLSLGIERGDKIAIYSDKKIQTYISILAILKIGAIFVPLDLKTPIRRVMYILRDAGVNLLLTDQKSNELLNNVNIPIVYSEFVYKGLEHTSPNISINENEIACLFYTSGSTGYPKGVLINHKGILRITYKNSIVNFKSHDKILQFSSLSFDVSLFEIWGSLLNGATLIISRNMKSISEIKSIINNSGVTIAALSPSIFNLLVDFHEEVFTSLKKVFVGGEVVSTKHINKVINKYNCEFYNGYGPTENTIHTTYYKIESEHHDYIPIGKPAPFTSMVVLNENNTLVSENEEGELVTLGPGVALGYNNLKSENFFKLTINGQTINAYRTGDQVLIQEGNLIFKGRKDNQVKIRGNRVELEEVKKNILAHNCVKEAHIEVKSKNQMNQLIGYVSLYRETDVNLLGELKLILPDYMIPDKIIYLDRLPLNSSDKIDSSALSAIGDQFVKTSSIENIIEDVLSIKVDQLDNLIEKGVNSLLILKIIANIEKNHGVRISYKEFLKNPNIKSLEYFVNKSKESSVIINNSEVLAPSSMQKSLWFQQQLLTDNRIYNVIKIVNFHRNLDLEKMVSSIKSVCNKNPILKTTFYQKDGDIKMDSHSNVDIKVCKLADNESFDEFYTNESNYNFKLNNNLSRFRLLIKYDVVKLIININHIIIDGESMEILVEKIINEYLYENQRADKKSLIKPALQQMKASQNYLDSIDSEPTKRIFAFETYEKSLGRMHKMNLEVSKDLKTSLKNLSLEMKSSLPAILLAAFKALIFLYSRQTDIQIGIPISVRHDAHGFDKTIGLFLNNLIVRQQSIDSMNVEQLICEVTDSFNIAIENRAIPFDTIVKTKMKKRNNILSDSPLYDITFNYHNYNRYHHPLIKEVEEPLEMFSKNKFGLDIFETDECLKVIFKFDESKFNPNYIEGMETSFLKILNNFSHDKNIQINDIDLSNDSSKTIYNTLNYRTKESIFIDTLFDTQVTNNPESIAVIHNNRTYTYKEIDGITEKILCNLYREGIRPGQNILISLEKGPILIATMLAIWKLGCSFIPYNSQFTKRDFLLIVENLKLNYFVCDDNQLFNHLEFRTINANNFDMDFSVSPPLKFNRQSNTKELAYITFTSGSIGLPKAIKVTHSSVINYLNYLNNEFALSRDTVTVQIPPITFDASIRDIFGTLVWGGKLVFPDKDKNPVSIINAIQHHKVNSILSVVPSFIEMLLEEMEKTTLSNNLIKLILLSGEKVTPDLVNRITSVIGTDIKIVNQYGPSECTLTSTFHLVDKNNDRWSVPVGKPIPNQYISILDKHYRPLPIGAIGEIFIGGAGLSDGYVGRDELNKETFVKDPLFSNKKIFKTNDLGYLNKDGELYFVSRKNKEIKHNGKLIDLEVVESNLSKFPYVRKAIVIVDKNNRIIFYLAGNRNEIIKNVWSDIQSHLDIIPQELRYITSMPHKENGKVDFTTLNSTDRTQIISLNEPVRKSNLTTAQSRLLKIFKENGLINMSTHTNFFEVGGHSLLAIKIINNINLEFKVQLGIKEFYQSPTIIKLEESISQNLSLIKNDNNYNKKIHKIKR
jgi:amino acid adenylation domain-containing protein